MKRRITAPRERALNIRLRWMEGRLDERLANIDRNLASAEKELAEMRREREARTADA